MHGSSHEFWAGVSWRKLAINWPRLASGSFEFHFTYSSFSNIDRGTINEVAFQGSNFREEIFQERKGLGKKLYTESMNFTF
jgi:hypothetical protein